MRLLIVVLTAVFVFAFALFALSNLNTRVPITIGDAVFSEVELSLVVLGAMGAGCLYIGVIAVAEGANLRLANRRMRKEIHQLETELNYLRTQPASMLDDTDEPATERAGEAPPDPGKVRGEVPSRPIYGTGKDRDDDDEVYTGGRAV